MADYRKGSVKAGRKYPRFGNQIKFVTHPAIIFCRRNGHRVHKMTQGARPQGKGEAI
jgi:hypothetical protein